MPGEVTERANEIAEQLSLSDITKAAARIEAPSETQEAKSSLTVSSGEAGIQNRRQKEVIAKIRELDLTNLTPMEAFFLLNDLQGKLKDKGN